MSYPNMKYGFTISKIKCSGCSFDGTINSEYESDERKIQIHIDLDKFYRLKEEAVVDVVSLHNNQRGLSCGGGAIRISFSNAVIIEMETKP